MAECLVKLRLGRPTRPEDGIHFLKPERMCPIKEACGEEDRGRQTQLLQHREGEMVVRS